MKSRSEIWLVALEELGDRCSVSTQRDAETVAKRVAQEGESFFTTTLPRFGKDFELALSWSRIPQDRFTGFSRKKLFVDIHDVAYGFKLETRSFGHGNPKFLGGFLDLVFRDTLEMTYDELSFALAHPSVMMVPRLERDTQDMVRMADAINAVRQLCLMFGKEKEQCSESAVVAAFRTYIQTDKELDAPLLTSEQPFSSVNPEKTVGSLRSEGRSD
jgi:hypothetical protein